MKKIVIMFATAMLVSGTAFADGYSNGGATVVAGQQQQTQSTATGLESGAINITIDQSQPETRGLEQSYVTQDIKYSGEYKLKNVPNVTAPGLTTTLTETCMGSTSVGGAMTGFGLSFGTTWRDSACVRRLDARELNSLGYRLGAKERMCDDELNRAALARAGTPCYVDLPVEQKRPEDQAVTPVAPAAATPALGAVESKGFDWSQLGG